MSFDWSGVAQAVIVAIPGLLAWRDAHKAHAVAKETKEEVSKVVGLVNGQQTALNEVVQKASERVGAAEGALDAERHKQER